MKRNAKNFTRLIALALAMLLLSSCAGCNFSELFNIVVPEETDENGNPITPDGSYPNSDGQSGLVDDSTDEPTEEPTEEVIVQYDAAMERQVQNAYFEQFVENPANYQQPSQYSITFLEKLENGYVIYVDDPSRNNHLSAIDIGGYEFRYPRDNNIYLFLNGTFAPLAECLDTQIITDEELSEIHFNFKKIYSERYKKYTAATIDSDFSTNYIIIQVQPEYSDEEYTVDDFSEVKDIVNIEEITSRDYREIYGDIGRSLTLKLAGASKEKILDAVKILQEREDFISAEVSYYGYTDETINDYYYVTQQQWSIDKIKLPSAWIFETGDNTVRVAVIDSGIDITHPDLVGKVNASLSKSFTVEGDLATTDEYFHGTFVAGIIGANVNNSLGIAGVCWNVEIVSLKVTDHLGRWEGPELVEALEYAEEIGIPLVNISLNGGDVPDLENSIEAYSGLVICSAGNSGGDLSVAPYRQYPAAYDCENMIVVGSATSSDTIAYHSNFNSTMVDLFAPGVDMISTYPIVKCQSGNCGETHVAEGYHMKSGTSFATPLVAGVAALVLAQNPTYTSAQIKSRILNSVDEVDALDGYCVTCGRLNAFNALHSHSYTYRYVSQGQSGHNAYCSCGAFAFDIHSFVANAGGIRCSKCNYRLN